MKENNVYLSQRLATNGDKFHLCCLMEKDFKEICKDFIWLEFTEIKDKTYPDQNMVWDNSDYLFVTFYKFLNAYLNRSLTPQDKEEFEDIYDYLDDNKCNDLLELLNTAKNLNWY